MSLIDEAAKFAEHAHRHQRRKYKGDPYFTHCQAVAELVMQRSKDPTVIAAAYLHDIIEDTEITEKDLISCFGAEVTALVVELTDVFTCESFPYLNRETRKGLEVQRIATISPSAKMIKICDLAHNTSDIVANAPIRFAQLYMTEKAALLEVLE
jgi:(p)ppGpp synthase/HD superfamily hydrolase